MGMSVLRLLQFKYVTIIFIFQKEPNILISIIILLILYRLLNNFLQKGRERAKLQLFLEKAILSTKVHVQES